jgi:hypothetical protein
MFISCSLFLVLEVPNEWGSDFLTLEIHLFLRNAFDEKILDEQKEGRGEHFLRRGVFLRR